jgi:tetratricopeptide (TPR) repeat protein
MHAARSREFLRYAVEHALAGNGGALKEYAIAVDVFDRDAGYDPAVDAVVRVEAGRLRTRLRDYYLDEGRSDQVLIEMARGGYGAQFSYLPGHVAAAPDAPVDLPPPIGPSVPLVRQHSPRWPWFAVAAVAIAVAGVSLWMHARRKPVPPSAAGGDVSVLVLPLQNHTGLPQDAYLSSGLSESLARELANVAGVRVGSQQAAAHYASTYAAGGPVPFEFVLNGSVELQDNAPVINIQFSNTRDGSMVLSRQYWEKAGGLPNVQANIVRDVVAALTALPAAQRQLRGPRTVTSNSAAYQAYLRGEYAAQTNSPQTLHEAIGHFEQAVRLDPDFARAWADLADTHALLGIYYERPRDHMPLARLYAQKALRLDSSLNEAHGTLGLVDLMYDWNVAAARQELSSEGGREEAFAVLSCTSHLLEQTGNTAEAEQLVRRLLTYEPRSAILLSELGCISYYRHDGDAALKYYRESTTLDPRSPLPYWGMAKVLSQEGKYDQAVAEIDRFPSGGGDMPPLLIAERGYALGAAGKTAAAKAEIAKLAQISQKQYVDPYFTAVIYLGFHDRSNALLWLARAEKERSPFIISIESEPKWEPMRSNPQFIKLTQATLSGGSFR